jgi:hypothetical protein
MATSIRKLVLVALLTFLASLDARALVFRAYLASDGNDANPCTLPQPCRLLPAALAAVTPGGEIWMLDSANYNTATVNITTSVTILAVPGVVGSVVATGGPAISVTTNSLVVSLRNLVIAPLPGTGGTDGVFVGSNSTVMIENSVFTRLPGNCVSAIGAGRLVVADSVLRSCGAAMTVQNGFLVEINNTRVLHNSNGIVVVSTVAGFTRVTVNDTTISGGYIGVHAFANIVGGNSIVAVTRSTIHAADYAMAAEAPAGFATVLVGSTQVHASGEPWWVSGAGASVRSYVNNQMVGNGAPTGALDTIASQ